MIVNGLPTGPSSWPRPPEQRRRRADLLLVVLVPLTGLAWLAVGFSCVAILDAMRVMLINGIDDWDAGTELVQTPLLGIFIGAITAASLLGFGVSWHSSMRFGSLSAGTRLSTAVSMGGAALGLLAAWLLGLWTAPVQVGAFAVDGFFITEEDGPEPWGIAGWIGYHAPWVLPLVLGAIALWCVVSIVREGSGERSAARKEREAKRHGTMMPGTITRVEYANTWVDGDPQFDITVNYSTPAGPRQTTRPLVAPLAHPPVVGGQVDVWYGYSAIDGDVFIEPNERTGVNLTNPGYRRPQG